MIKLCWSGFDQCEFRGRNLRAGLSPMSLSQQAIFRYTSSHAVTVIASMILGMKRASRGISLIPITNSCKVTGSECFCRWIFAFGNRG